MLHCLRQAQGRRDSQRLPSPDDLVSTAVARQAISSKKSADNAMNMG